jgi:hypothetical protein
MTEYPEPLNSPVVCDLIERLYSAFNEPNDLLTGAWYAAHREEVVAELIKYDRRNLYHHAAIDAHDWLVWSLTYTIGTPQTLRHYLPTVFEALLRYSSSEDDFWMFVKKIAGAGFSDWSLEQRRLVCAVVRVWLAYRIMQTEGVTAHDFPELEPEVVIATTPASFLLELLGTVGNTIGFSDPEVVDFILNAERALASSLSQATKTAN